MTDDLRHNMNLVIPGLNFWGDQTSSAQSVVDKTKWVMQTAIDRIEKLEAALREIIGSDELSFVPPILRDIARKALEGKDER
jgi:hypothetical protein